MNSIIAGMCRTRKRIQKMENQPWTVTIAGRDKSVKTISSEWILLEWDSGVRTRSKQNTRTVWQTEGQDG